MNKNVQIRKLKIKETKNNVVCFYFNIECILKQP